MIDWTQIIIALLGVGGLTTIFTVREKKTSLFLENVQKTTEEWSRVATERKAMYDDLKGDYDKLMGKFDEQLKINSSIRHRLDDANTEAAVNKLLKCTLTACVNRKPPLGAGQTEKSE